MKVIIANASPYKNRFVEIDLGKGRGLEIVCVPPKGTVPRNGSTIVITEEQKKKIELDQYLKVRVIQNDAPEQVKEIEKRVEANNLNIKTNEKNSKNKKNMEDSKK